MLKRSQKKLLMDKLDEHYTKLLKSDLERVFPKERCPHVRFYETWDKKAQKVVVKWKCDLPITDESIAIAAASFTRGYNAAQQLIKKEM